jgi:hypothetical protein
MNGPIEKIVKRKEILSCPDDYLLWKGKVIRIFLQIEQKVFSTQLKVSISGETEDKKMRREAVHFRQTSEGVPKEGTGLFFR